MYRGETCIRICLAGLGLGEIRQIRRLATGGRPLPIKKRRHEQKNAANAAQATMMQPDCLQSMILFMQSYR